MNSEAYRLERLLSFFKLCMSLFAVFFLYRYVVSNFAGIAFFDFSVEKQALAGRGFNLSQARAHYAATRSSLEVPLMYAFIVIHPLVYLLVSFVMHLKIRSALLGVGSRVVHTRSAMTSGNEMSVMGAMKANERDRDREHDWS